MEENPNFVVVAFLVFLFSIVVFLICREIVCWYWKINKRISKQEEMIEKLNVLTERIGEAVTELKRITGANRQE